MGKVAVKRAREALGRDREMTAEHVEDSLGRETRGTGEGVRKGRNFRGILSGNASIHCTHDDSSHARRGFGQGNMGSGTCEMSAYVHSLVGTQPEFDRVVVVVSEKGNVPEIANLATSRFILAEALSSSCRPAPLLPDWARDASLCVVTSHCVIQTRGGGTHRPRSPLRGNRHLRRDAVP